MWTTKGIQKIVHMTQWNSDGIQLVLQSLVLADRERQWALQLALSDDNWGVWHHCIFFIVATSITDVLFEQFLIRNAV